MVDFCWIHSWMQSEFLAQPKCSQSGFKRCIFILRENINATHEVKLENWTLYLIIIWEALPWDIRRINSLNLNTLLIPAKCLSNLPKYSTLWEMFTSCYISIYIFFPLLHLYFRLPLFKFKNNYITIITPTISDIYNFTCPINESNELF